MSQLRGQIMHDNLQIVNGLLPILKKLHIADVNLVQHIVLNLGIGIEVEQQRQQ